MEAFYTPTPLNFVNPSITKILERLGRQSPYTGVVGSRQNLGPETRGVEGRRICSLYEVRNPRFIHTNKILNQLHLTYTVSIVTETEIYLS